MPKAQDLTSGTFSFEDAEKLEHEHIQKRRLELNLTPGSVRDNLSALSLSGGGVRSASFCLGVARALAEGKLLKYFDYLSTVSGGGYAGAFLTRWAKEKGYETVETELANDLKFSDPGSPLSHLRRYIAYLTPKLGLTSLDSLAVITLFLRNLVINWLVIMPWIFAACLIPQLLQNGLAHIDLSSNNLRLTFAVLAAGALFLSYIKSHRSRPVVVGDPIPADHSDPPFPGVFTWFAVPAFLVLISVMMIFGRNQLANVLTDFQKISRVPESLACNTNLENFQVCVSSHVMLFAYNNVNLICAGAAVAGLVYYLHKLTMWQTGMTTPQIRVNRVSQKEYVSAFLTNLLVFLFRLAAGLLVIYLGQFALGKLSPKYSIELTVVALPLLLHVAFAAADAFSNALYSYKSWSDTDQEWTARLTGSLLSLPVIWTCLSAISVWGPDLIPKGDEASWFSLTSLGTATGVSGIAGILLTRISSLYEKAQKGLKLWQELGLRWSLAIVLTLFLVLLVLGFSYLGKYLTDLWVPLPPKVTSHGYTARVWAILALGIAPLVAAGFLDFYSNLNRFSLHAIYRNRLVRAFVGAANPDRINRMPGFLNLLRSDNIEMHKLDQHGGTVGPSVHIINMAMNMPGSNELSLQERKAVPFTASPFTVGSGSLPLDDPKGWYRKASEYALGVSPQAAADAIASGNRNVAPARAISLGSAIAVSGAAFDPSMGRFGSGAMRLLLTLCNVRLGVWYGNPGPVGDKTYYTRGPGLMIMRLASEFLGLADEGRKYVHLSDGGHFENLATYEMLRRKCTFIVMVDAGCDPDYLYEDLAILQRIARVDLNAHIEMPAVELTKLAKGEQQFVIGSVVYRDHMNAYESDGVICYIKPTVSAGLQPEISSYHKTNATFPHETTANQFFTESQFLSYLRLGELQGRSLVAALKREPQLRSRGWT